MTHNVVDLAAADTPAYSYPDGSAMSAGDLCVIASLAGVWEIVYLHTFTNGRSYASLISTRSKVRRTAADLHELRLCRSARSA